MGLVLARQLVKRNARVAFCARTEEDVEAAAEELRRRGGAVSEFVCDIREPQQVQAMVESVKERWGAIDVLFNVAGIIEVGPAEAMTHDDFRRAMETNYFGALHAILAVLPSMRERGEGRIVNVTSIGGIQAVPHLLPYSASKFALVGLSSGLRGELAKDGILVTTAYPTLMRTGSPRNAVFKANHRLEFAWFNSASSLPFLSMDANRAATQIIRACENGDAEVYVSNLLNPPMLAARFAPKLTGEVLALANRFLPGMGGIDHKAAWGYQSQSALSPSWLTLLGEWAAGQNNELRPRPLAAAKS